MMMKIILYKTLLVILVAGCEIDNYEAPALTLTGSIIDAQTQEQVASGGVNAGSVIKLYQDNATQPIILKTFPGGTFTNTKLFAGSYSYVAEGPFEMVEQDPAPLLMEKDMTLDVEVIPHMRVEAEVIEAGTTTARVRLRFQKVAADKDLVQVGIIWSTYPHPNNFTFEGGGIQLENMENPELTEGEKEFLLEGLKPGTRYYLRGSGLAANPGGYYNYSTQVELLTK